MSRITQRRLLELAGITRTPHTAAEMSEGDTALPPDVLRGLSLRPATDASKLALDIYLAANGSIGKIVTAWDTLLMGSKLDEALRLARVAVEALKSSGAHAALPLARQAVSELNRFVDYNTPSAGEPSGPDLRLTQVASGPSIQQAVMAFKTVSMIYGRGAEANRPVKR